MLLEKFRLSMFYKEHLGSNTAEPSPKYIDSTNQITIASKVA